MDIKKIEFDIKRLAFLLLLTFFACILFLFRGVVLGERQHLFVFWNLFLAWIPYVISCIMLLINRYKDSKRWTLGLLPIGVLWLLFFPNAPYMLTTYALFSWQGLALIYQEAPFELQPWYDFILFSSVTFSGVLAGVSSLQIVHGIIEKHFSKLIGWSAVAVISFLSSWAIYLGRFVRLNSWDLLRNPDILLPHIFLCRERFLAVFILGVFLILVYTVCYTGTKFRRGCQNDKNIKPHGAAIYAVEARAIG
jgi:uncharacterized membrane protein